MDCSRILFSRHAVQRMFERDIPQAAVAAVLRDGEVVESYPGDHPYPSCLLLGWHGGRPLHVVAAREAASGLCVVITTYVPEAAQWQDGFKTRRMP